MTQPTATHEHGAPRLLGYRSIEVLRGTWGLALLASPDWVLTNIHGLSIDSKSRVVARVLGARHLTQAVLSGYRPSPEVLAMGTWVDSVHALTAIGLAVADHHRARAGLVDAAVAAIWAAAGYHDLRSADTAPPEHQRVRDKLAVAVLNRVPAGRDLATIARRDRRT